MAQTRSDESTSREPSPPLEVRAAAARPRSRLRQALVCPYCRDAVSRLGTVACARSGCGALYHRECWDECIRSYGGCAVYGCESRRSREVSATGYLLRVLRLFVAALFLPPRVLRAVARHREEGAASVFRIALARALEIRRRLRDANLGLAVVTLLGLPLSCGIVAFWCQFSPSGDFLAAHPGLGNVVAVLMAATIFGGPFSTPLWAPSLVAFFLTLGFYGAKALARALRSEFAALARADDGGGTVLGRLRGGMGKK